MLEIAQIHMSRLLYTLNHILLQYVTS